MPVDTQINPYWQVYIFFEVVDVIFVRQDTVQIPTLAVAKFEACRIYA